MRNFGGTLLLLGVIGFFYCSSQLEESGPPPEGLSISESFAHPTGRYEIGRWASACAAAFGGVMALFPKGR